MRDSNFFLSFETDQLNQCFCLDIFDSIKKISITSNQSDGFKIDFLTIFDHVHSNSNIYLCLNFKSIILMAFSALMNLVLKFSNIVLNAIFFKLIMQFLFGVSSFISFFCINKYNFIEFMSNKCLK